MAVGGTVAMMMHFGEIAKQYTKIPVYVEHAAEIVLTGHSQLNKDSIVIMGSKSGDTKGDGRRRQVDEGAGNPGGVDGH